jgi:hypothetical protein
MTDFWAQPIQSETKKEYTPLPDGKYDAIVETVFVAKSKTDKEYIDFTLKVVDGEFKNRKIFDKKWLTEKALPYTRKELDAVGVKPESREQLEGSLEALIGATLAVWVTTEPAQGEFKAKNRARLLKRRAENEIELPGLCTDDIKW